jgi:CDP-diacylglycerol---serine O-phosphatidyltransferase
MNNPLKSTNAADLTERKNSQRKKRLRLHNMLFILPNAFTLASIFSGLYAILLCATENDQDTLYQAAIAIFFAGFFDMFDGRVARLTKTQSDFGVELDSLADVISFGVAPAIIMYKWALWPLGFVGFLCAFFYVACGAIRLARFNVLTFRLQKPSSFFVGLPIPLAATMLILLVIAHFKLFGGLPVQSHMLVFSLVLLLGGLMVSPISYWSFKELHFSPASIATVVTVSSLIWIIGLRYPVSICLVAILGFYIVAGICRSLFFKLR